MGLALKNDIQNSGVARNDVEASLQRVAMQLNLLDEKLKNRFDHEIWKQVQHEQENIKKVEANIANILEYK